MAIAEEAEIRTAPSELVVWVTRADPAINGSTYNSVRYPVVSAFLT